MSAARCVAVSHHDGVTEIVLDRPERRNAIDARLHREFVEAVQEFDADPDARVAIVTGRDPAFCAGMDLDELGARGVTFATPVTYDQALRAVGKPVVGAVNGAAVTGGLELALHCDFLLASDRARFGDTHSRVGVLAGGGLTVLLGQAVGLRMARQMSFTGALVDAETALRAGLVNEVVAHEELLPRARRVALEIAANDPGLIAAHRDAYRRAANLPADEALDAERAAASARRASAETVAAGRAAVLGVPRHGSATSSGRGAPR